MDGALKLALFEPLRLRQVLSEVIDPITLQGRIPFILFRKLLTILLRYKTDKILNRYLQPLAQLLTTLSGKVALLEQASRVGNGEVVERLEVEGRLDQHKGIHFL